MLIGLECLVLRCLSGDFILLLYFGFQILHNFYSVLTDHCPKCEIVFSFLAWVEVWHRTVMPPWLFLVTLFMRSCPTELTAFAILIGFMFTSLISGEVIITRVGLHWEVLFI